MRIQVIVDEVQKERILRRAQTEGLSMSAWIRRAALRELDARRPEDRTDRIRMIFAAADRLESRTREPSWEESKRLLRDGRDAVDTGT